MTNMNNTYVQYMISEQYGLMLWLNIKNTWLHSTLKCSGRWTHPSLLRAREPSDERIYSPIGCFFFPLIGMIGSWLAAGGLSPLKHLRLALRQLSSRTHAQLGAAEEESTDRGASWNPGGKTVRWPNCRRNQKQQVCISITHEKRLIND